MIVDNIGADVLAPCIEALAVGGRYVTIGRMSGVLKGELDVDQLAEHRLHLYGVSNRLRNAAQRAESMRRFIADLMPALSEGRIRPTIDRSFPLADLAAAQAHVEGGTRGVSRGRVGAGTKLRPRTRRAISRAPARSRRAAARSAG